MQFKPEEPLEWTVYEHDNLKLLHYCILIIKYKDTIGQTKLFLYYFLIWCGVVKAIDDHDEAYLEFLLGSEL